MLVELLTEAIERDRYLAAKGPLPIAAVENLEAPRTAAFSSAMLLICRPATGLVIALLSVLAVEALMFVGCR